MSRTCVLALCTVMLAVTPLALAQQAEQPEQPKRVAPQPDRVIILRAGEDDGQLRLEPGFRWLREQADPDNPTGEKKYGFLGIVPGEVPGPLADQLGLDDGRGVLVLSVQKDAPAEKAGLQRNDVITMIDDQIIYAVEQLKKLVAARKPGAAVKVALIRKARKQTANVELGGTAVRSWRRRPGPAAGIGGGLWPMMPGQPGPQLRPPMIERRPGRGILRYRGPGGEGVEIRIEAGKDLLNSLEPFKDDIPPKVWNRIKKMLEATGQPRPPQTPDPQPDKPEPQGEKPKADPGAAGPAIQTRPGAAGGLKVTKQQQIQLRVGPGGAAGGAVVIQGKAVAGGGENFAMSSVSAASANYRAAWETRTGQPTLVSLYDKDGNAIFEKVTPDQLPKLMDTLDQEACDLLSKTKLTVKVDGAEQ